MINNIHNNRTCRNICIFQAACINNNKRFVKMTPIEHHIIKLLVNFFQRIMSIVIFAKMIINFYIVNNVFVRTYFLRSLNLAIIF